MTLSLKVIVSAQQLLVLDNNQRVKQYAISSAKKGVGESLGSEQTPSGRHVIRAKIGTGCPTNTVFVERRRTGLIYSDSLKETYPHRDWILTRILWLSGLEKGKNRLGLVDTMRRYIYIHGTPEDVPMGIPGSRGCIRMKNEEIIELFDLVRVGTEVEIEV